MRAIGVLATIALVANSAATHAAESDDWFTVFQLLDNCAGMHVIVRLNLSQHDKRIDLTDSVIRNATESRVRSANIHKQAPGPQAPGFNRLAVDVKHSQSRVLYASVLHEDRRRR